MEIKIKNISCVLFFLIVSLSGFCQKKETKSDWIRSYKEGVIWGGYVNGINNRELTDRLKKIDKSFYNPVFYNLHSKSLKRGIDELVKLINIDYQSRYDQVADPADGKRIFEISLKFYSSGLLNKIANEEYLKWLKVPNKEHLVKKASESY